MSNILGFKVKNAELIEISQLEIIYDLLKCINKYWEITVGYTFEVLKLFKKNK